MSCELAGLGYNIRRCNRRLVNGSGSFSDVIAAIERATDPDHDPVTDDGADIVSMSLGGPVGPDSPVSRAIDAAVDLGAMVVVSAGNQA